MTHSLHWESGRASFKTVRGPSQAGAAVVSEHVFMSGVPSPGQEQIALAFFVVASKETPLQNDSEVVIDKFEYRP